MEVVVQIIVVWSGGGGGGGGGGGRWVVCFVHRGGNVNAYALAVVEMSTHALAVVVDVWFVLSYCSS